MYIDTRNMTPEEITRKKRQLRMQQLSYESDLKKVERKKDELATELRQYKIDRDRLSIAIKNTEAEMKKIPKKKIMQVKSYTV